MLRLSDSAGMGVPSLLWKEFLDGCEDNAARIHRKLIPQVGAVLRLHRRLTQQVLAPRKGAEKLVVQVVAVSEHHHGGVLHCRLPNDGPCVEGHSQALTRPLRVPDDTDAAVSGVPARLSARLVPAAFLGDSHPLQLRRPQRLVHRHPHGVELVIARHLLSQCSAAVILEHYEVPHQRQESVRLERTFQHHLKLGEVRVRQLLSGDGAPGLEPLPTRRKRADSGLGPVGHH